MAKSFCLINADKKVLTGLCLPFEATPFDNPQHEGDLHPLPPPWYCLDKVTYGARYNGNFFFVGFLRKVNIWPRRGVSWYYPLDSQSLAMLSWHTLLWHISGQLHRDWRSQAEAGSVISCHLCGVSYNDCQYNRIMRTSRRCMRCSSMCSRWDWFY